MKRTTIQNDTRLGSGGGGETKILRTSVEKDIPIELIIPVVVISSAFF